MSFTTLAEHTIQNLLNCSSGDSLSPLDRGILSLRSADWLEKDLLLDGSQKLALESLQTEEEKAAFISDAIVYKLAAASIEFKLQIYNKVFQDLPTTVAKRLAKDHSSGENNENSAEKMLSGDVYGEVEFSSFCYILQRSLSLLKSEAQRKVFVDLGHGTGKALVAAALLYGDVFARIHGIEHATGLHNESLHRLEMFQDIVKENHVFGSSPVNNITAEEGDFFAFEGSSQQFKHFDWTTADVVFANSTCFNQSMMERLAKFAERMKVGAIFVCLTYTLPYENTQKAFEIVEQVNLLMSWGTATAFIHRRI